MTLSKDGPDKFIKEAYKEAYILRGLHYKPEHGHPGPGKTMSFHDFIWCIFKFTNHYHHPVNLEGEIAEDEEGLYHKVKLWGIRDYDLRSGKQPHYMRGYQEGFWDETLETLLRRGVLVEDVDSFRHQLNITPRHDVTDTEFFKRSRDTSV